ncbi:MAG: glycosyltransferase [Gammaproteobacteria bacterium]|nr:glycosyltransferase [Gammaproteobacteria bacterium]
MTNKLIIFTKAPEPGQVKTRLIPALGAVNAAKLYHRLLIHTLQQHSKQQEYSIELCCTPDTNYPLFHTLQKDYGCQLSVQTGTDLGQRMHHALQQALTESPRAILIGCDCPLLSATDILQGFELLAQDNELVLGPAEDGGYVMIGLSSPHESLFQGINWGSDQVYQQTIERTNTLNIRHASIASHWDLDLPEDLERLKASPKHADLVKGLW